MVYLLNHTPLINSSFSLIYIVAWGLNLASEAAGLKHQQQTVAITNLELHVLLCANDNKMLQECKP